MSKTLTTPTVHLNGTSAKDLAEQYATAYQAMNDALQVLQGATPNARDYYVQGADAFTRAATEHMSRVFRLEDIRDELLALHDAVEAQVAQRDNVRRGRPWEDPT